MWKRRVWIRTEQALGQLGRLVQATFRDADLAGRVDRTDCGILLTKVRPAQTGIALDRLQEQLVPHNAQAGAVPLMVRAGLAHFDPAQPCAFEELVARADAGDGQNQSQQSQSRQPDNKTTTNSDV